MSRCSKCGTPEFTQGKLKGLVKRDFKLEKENKLLHDNIDVRDKINLELTAENKRLQEEMQKCATSIRYNQITLPKNPELADTVNKGLISISDKLTTSLEEVKK